MVGELADRGLSGCGSILALRSEGNPHSCLEAARKTPGPLHDPTGERMDGWTDEFSFMGEPSGCTQRCLGCCLGGS